MQIEPERYELFEAPRYSFAVNRREFLGVLGAGLWIAALAEDADAQGPRGGGSRDEKVAARLHIAEDGRITVMTSKVEVGQGSRTELTQAAAEELRVNPDDITLIMGDTELCPDDGGTAGSGTTPRTVPSVRRGAAAAREILVDLAAAHWGVGRESLVADAGKITQRGTSNSITYGELAKQTDKAHAFDRNVESGIALTEPKNWRVLGTPVPKPTGHAIVTGTHKYASDMTRPGMLYGSILRPVAYNATLKSIDLQPAKDMGVVAVRDGNFVGCAAPRSFTARKAVEAIRKSAVWEEVSGQPSSTELFTWLKQKASNGGGGRGRGTQKGSLEAGLAQAAKKTSASYEVPYIQHAPMEPRAALAEWNNGKVTVWTGTQQPARVRGDLARAFGIDQDDVRVIVPDTGGGFGGKHTGEAAVEAARLAKTAGKPVLLRWTREEEFTWAYFRPAALIEAQAGLNSDGTLTAWEFTNYNSGGSALASPYRCANVKEEFRQSDSPLREGSYRVLAATANNFARESFLDEVAALNKVDPLEFRLHHLEEGRLRDVLVAATDRFHWKDKKKDGRAVGLACGTEKGSYVASCVEVAIEKNAIRILDICQAYECGGILNPDNLKAQVDGCILMTLGGTLFEEMHFKNGRILNGRFADYRVPRFRDVPSIDVVLLDRKDLPSAGAGETPMMAIAPAVGNAVFAATGVRLRRMPLRMPG